MKLFSQSSLVFGCLLWNKDSTMRFSIPKQVMLVLLVAVATALPTEQENHHWRIAVQVFASREPQDHPTLTRKSQLSPAINRTTVFLEWLS